MIYEATKAVVAFQNKYRGVVESDIVVNIPGECILFTSTLNSMARWHGCSKFVKAVKSAFRWFCEVSGYAAEEDWLHMQGPTIVQATLDELELNGPQVDLYDFYGSTKPTAQSS